MENFNSMELNSISSKHGNELEQMIMQILKTMRQAKLQHHPVYMTLQTLERDLGEIRRKRYEETDSRYSDY